MRDAQIYSMNERRAESDILLYKQMNFLNTRMMAYEEVLSSRGAMLKAIWNPEWLKQEVDRVHMNLLRIHDQQVRKAAENASRLTVIKHG